MSKVDGHFRFQRWRCALAAANRENKDMKSNERTFRIDLKKLALYLLKRAWILIICGAIGFGGLYWYTAYYKEDTFSAYATMYVLNGNPNLVNYQYTNTSDLNSAVQLLQTYMVVVRSNKVMNVVAERLSADYPGISPTYIANTLSMGSVADTGVLEVVCTTYDPQLSADICNAVLDTAPSEIIRVVSAGSIEIIDFAETPVYPDSRSPVKKGMIGGLAGIVLAGGLLAFLFLKRQKIESTDDLTNNFNLPVLASVKRSKNKSDDPKVFLLNENSPIDTMETYAKLRMNLFYMMAEKKNRVVILTSSISGEGKSTISANLAVSCALSDKRILIIDGDMRRACQSEIFDYTGHSRGLSDVLIHSCELSDVIRKTSVPNLDLLLAGKLPPNPAELLSTEAMKKLLDDVQEIYDLVFLDMPPINIVSDPLTLAPLATGCLFVVRQNYSSYGEICKALVAADLAGMNVMGFVFYGENIYENRYYGRKYYKKYGYSYDHRRENAVKAASTDRSQKHD